jgi:hypothetical protein
MIEHSVYSEAEDFAMRWDGRRRVGIVRLAVGVQAGYQVRFCVMYADNGNSHLVGDRAVIAAYEPLRLTTERAGSPSHRQPRCGIIRAAYQDIGKILA